MGFLAIYFGIGLLFALLMMIGLGGFDALCGKLLDDRNIFSFVYAGEYYFRMGMILLFFAVIVAISWPWVVYTSVKAFLKEYFN